LIEGTDQAARRNQATWSGYQPADWQTVQHLKSGARIDPSARVLSLNPPPRPYALAQYPAGCWPAASMAADIPSESVLTRIWRECHVSALRGLVPQQS